MDVIQNSDGQNRHYFFESHWSIVTVYFNASTVEAQQK